MIKKHIFKTQMLSPQSESIEMVSIQPGVWKFNATYIPSLSESEQLGLVGPHEFSAEIDGPQTVESLRRDWEERSRTTTPWCIENSPNETVSVFYDVYGVAPARLLETKMSAEAVARISVSEG